MKKILLILSILYTNLCWSQDTIAVVIHRTGSNEIYDKIEKFTKKSKDFKILTICRSEKTIIFQIENQYTSESLLITLELEYIDSEFDLKNWQDISDNCKNFLKEPM
jgi:hypothetical protein